MSRGGVLREVVVEGYRAVMVAGLRATVVCQGLRTTVVSRGVVQ